MRLHYLAAALGLVVACQQGKADDQKKAVTPPVSNAATDKPALDLPADPLLDPAAVKWKPHEVAGLGIQMNAIDGVEVLAGSFNQGARYTRQEMRPIMLSIWHGQDR